MAAAKNSESAKTAKKPAAKKTTPKQSPTKKTSPALKGKNTKKSPSRAKTVKAPPQPKPMSQWTIAERVAFRKRNKHTILACFAMALLLLLAGFFLFCVQGYSFSALVCVCLTAIIGFYTFVPKLRGKYPKFVRTVTRIFTIILCIGLLVVGITEALIIRASFGDTGRDCDYLLVLGAKVRNDGPSLSLSNRINAAYDYLTENPNVIAVVSGGQGADEPMTEAKCMYDQLTARGIDPSRVWMEDRATSTWENLHFSLDLIEEKTGQRPGKLAVLSSEYHLFRASLFADACGVEFIGVPAATTNPVLKVNYFMREVAGVWHYLLLGGQYHA